MSIARTRLAAGSARRLLTRLQIESPPVDVGRVAHHLGIKLQEEAFPDGISAVLLRSEGGALIAVNKEHHPNRQRFSVAHEVGHYLLHRDAAGYYDRKHQIGVHFRASTTGGSWDPKEIEANRFAAELLMPRRMIIDAIQRAGAAEASALARQFEVSEEAMTYRLADIRLR